MLLAGFDYPSLIIPVASLAGLFAWYLAPKQHGCFVTLSADGLIPAIPAPFHPPHSSWSVIVWARMFAHSNGQEKDCAGRVSLPCLPAVSL